SLCVATSRTTPACAAILDNRAAGPGPFSSTELRANASASPRAAALSLSDNPAAAVATPFALASAFPCVLSLISRKTRKPIAIMGTTTIRTKKLVRRLRKLMASAQPVLSVSGKATKTDSLVPARGGRPTAGRRRGRGYTPHIRAASAAARGYSSVGRAPG